ncbi:MAG: rod shape-determining protein MreC [Alloprevotella sp.]|nr:rod shape-determining protein MreC [Alloprevotella sp.]
MRTILEFLRRYNYLFLFLVLEAVSFTLLFRFNSYQGNVWLTAAGRVTARLNALYGEGESYLNLRYVNSDLVRRNILLQQQNEKLREALAKKGGTSHFIDSLTQQAAADLSMTAANVVSSITQRRNNYIVVNRGTADGIRPEQGVVGGQGVVGIVYLCEEHNSLVIPLTNRRSNLSCRVRGGNYFGSLTWDGKDLRYATLDDIPRYAKVKKDDIVETSGFSAVFPPGLFVGRVTEVRNSSDGQSYTLIVHLGTDFSTLRDVNIISTSYKAETDSLRQRAAQLEPDL